MSVAGCRGEPLPPPRRLNVVLILVDTLRADHLGAYGYGRDTSPNLDAFAASGVLFEDARSQASCTFPSVNSILTSRYPARFVGQPEGRMGIPEGIASLAEVLKARSYATAAVSASPIVRRTPSHFNPEGGFGRGFDSFSEECVWKSALCVEAQLAARLPQLSQPFFLYLHYMEPHGPYQPPATHRLRFAGPYLGPHDFIARGDPNPLADMIYKGKRRLEVTAADVAHLVDLYDDEIAFFDERLPAVLAALAAAGAGDDDTLVAVVSDHGEEFLEHGHVKHCRTPFDTLVHVPLLLRVPGGPAGVRVAAPVENLDLVPTILDYLGADPAAFGFEGESLRPLIEGRAVAGGSPRYAFSAEGVWRSVADGRFKLLVHMRGPRSYQLFDLAADPGETRDVGGEHPEDLRRLKRAVLSWVRRMHAEAGTGVAEGEEAERRLKALGYLQ
jgi:arylsulfatase A-like enzyme